MHMKILIHIQCFCQKGFLVCFKSSADKKIKYLRNKFEESDLLPGIENLTGVHKTSKTTLFGTKYSKECLLQYKPITIGCIEDPPIPVFRSIIIYEFLAILFILRFMYWRCMY